MWRPELRIGHLALLALTLGVSESVAAQEPGGSLPLPGWVSVDWMTQTAVSSLPSDGQALVLADEVELDGSTSANPRNPRIVLIADHLKVSRAARINASSLGAGKDVTVVARKLTCDGGALEIDVSGLDVTESNVDRPGRSYRDLEVANSQACHAACLADAQCQVWTYSGAPGAGAPGGVEVRDHRVGRGAYRPAAVPRQNCFLKDSVHTAQRAPGMESGMRPKPGHITVAVESAPSGDSCVVPRFSAQAAAVAPAGRRGAARALAMGDLGLTGSSGFVKKVGPDAITQFLKLPDATLSTEQREKIVSGWTTRLLKRREASIKLALQRPDYREALARLGDVRALQQYPIRSEDLDQFSQVVAALKQDRDSVPPFVIEPFVLTTPWGDRTVDVWFETNTATAFVPPTMLLVDPIEFAGKRGLAYLSFDPARPDQLILQINARLAQDPWLVEQVRAKLAERGWKQGAGLSAWRFQTDLGPVFGVRDQKVVQSGEVLQLGLTLDAVQGNVALARLIGSDVNLELRVSVPTSPNVASTLRVPLSLARSSQLPGIAIAQGAIENKGPLAVRITHLEMNDGSLRALDPAVEVAAGRSSPLPRGFDQARRVPVAGGEYRLDAQHFLDYVVAADASPLVETVSITNLLGPDPARGGALQYVEINVDYASGGAPPVHIDAVRLASRGTLDSERRLSFLRAPGDRTIRIEGRAYYEGGSSQKIGPLNSSSAIIKITEEAFP